MKFKELNSIAQSNKTKSLSHLYVNSFELAKKFNLRLKNSLECKQDFPDRNPLEKNNAIYALYKGEYTIYYDEKYAYKNFAIAHEIAHHLLQHESDGAAQHHDANILAAILVAPKKSVVKNKIKNEFELSEKYIMPIGVAQVYWKHLNIRKSKQIKIYAPLIVLSVTIPIIASYGAYYIKSNTNIQSLQIENNITETQLPLSLNEAIDIPSSSKTDVSTSIYVTISGRKYHKPTCFHIKNKTNTIELSTAEALNAGYEACKDCIKQ